MVPTITRAIPTSWRYNTMTTDDIMARRQAIRTASPRLAHTLEDSLWRDFIKYVGSLANSKESPATLLTRLISQATLILTERNGFPSLTKGNP